MRQAVRMRVAAGYTIIEGGAQRDARTVGRVCAGRQRVLLTTTV